MSATDEVKKTARHRKELAKKQSGGSFLVNTYLVLYNVASALGWGYILVTTVLHIYSATLPSPPAQTPLQNVVSTTVRSILSRIPLTFSNTTPLAQVQAKVYELIPPALLPFIERAKTLYDVNGEAVIAVQSVAVLEVLHALFGFVRSPVITTAMQVASRLFLVWGILPQYPGTRSNPFYASMVFAWSLTEVIRYSYYAFNIVGFEPKFLTYLRYTLFYILYPVGASSEAFLNFSTLPTLPSLESFTFPKSWDTSEYVRFGLFLLWWPGLYVMYTYMIKQRRKVIGGVPLKKTKAKTA